MYRLAAARDVVPHTVADVRPLNASRRPERLSGARMLSRTDVCAEMKRINSLSVFSKLIHEKAAGSEVWPCRACVSWDEGSTKRPVSTTPARAVYAPAATQADCCQRRRSSPAAA